MSLTEFAQLVRAMRKYQILYGKSRQPSDREAAIHLERQVDREAGQILWPGQEGSLFDAAAEEGGER